MIGVKVTPAILLIRKRLKRRLVLLEWRLETAASIRAGMKLSNAIACTRAMLADLYNPKFLTTMGGSYVFDSKENKEEDGRRRMVLGGEAGRSRDRQSKTNLALN